MSKNRRYNGKILPIRVYGDKVLRVKSLPVQEISEEIKDFIADLAATMYAKDGIGLAAPQVGNNIRIFVIDPQWFETNEKKPVIFINPKFLSMSGVTENDEGCLSLPEIFAAVKRAEEVVIEAKDENGKIIKYKAEGLFARAIQHEYDHLDGILFTDRISKIKQLSLRAKLKKLESYVNEEGVNLDEDIIIKQNNLHGNT